MRDRYAEIARTERGCGCAPSCCSPDNVSTTTSEDLGYRKSDLATLPTGADMGLGCGTPLAFASLRAGETVVDLGSGGGIDVLLSAKRVGATGFAYGLDMTDEMLALAQQNKAAAGVENVQFLKGHLPILSC